MPTILKLLSRLLSPKPMRIEPAPLILGRGLRGAQVLGAILACTKPDAIRARSENYRRSVRRILERARN